MSAITTHVLDTSAGKPAAGVPVTLELQDGKAWKELAREATNADGRVPAGKLTSGALKAGTYRITFDTAAYFRARGTAGFYPYVAIVFEIGDPAQHYHVPLLLNPYGYSTYRGS
jgi:5-hydroxyisourate hydrolase